MKADEIISKADLFATNFIAKLSDKSEQPAKKQAFFLDNQEELTKYMGALQKVVNSITIDEDGDPITVEEDSEEGILVVKASNVITKLKDAIREYQKELEISNDISEEDTTATLTQETIADAMKTNKSTQEISANMQAIAEQQKVNQIPFNYALVCDGQINMIAADTKAQLNDSINALANTGNYKDIQLYQLTFTPVQLKKQTVLTV